MAFRNTKTRREGERKRPNRQRSKTFLEKLLSKQTIKASLASLSFDSSRAPTEWSAIFAFGVFRTPSSRRYLRHFMVAKVSLELRPPKFYLAPSFAHREQRPLWVYTVRWKRTWRTKSYGVSIILSDRFTVFK